MKMLLSVSPARSTWTKPLLTLILTLALMGAFWAVTAPVALGRLMTPTEMIEAGLPPGIMMKTAGKPQFLTAVCAAVKQHRKSAPAIARTAVAAHHEYSGDIVATVVRCIRGEGEPDCALTGEIVAAAIAAWPDSASAIVDAALAVAPGCADAIQSATEKPEEEAPAEGPGNYSAPPSYLTPPIGSIGGGGGFNPQDPVVQVCDNDRQRAIRTSRIDHYLRTHAGSYIGVCQVTAVVNR